MCSASVHCAVLAYTKPLAHCNAATEFSSTCALQASPCSTSSQGRFRQPGTLPARDVLLYGFYLVIIGLCHFHYQILFPTQYSLYEWEVCNKTACPISLFFLMVPTPLSLYERKVYSVETTELNAHSFIFGFQNLNQYLLMQEFCFIET